MTSTEPAMDVFLQIDPTNQAASFEAGAVSDTGRVRKANEDRFFVEPANGVFAVADGMGGHEAGELASGAIVDQLASVGMAVSASDLLARVEDRILRANAVVQEISAQRGKVVGSTVVILLVYDGHFACVWAGDSRIYRVRNGALEQLSRDHTEVQDLLEQGLLTPETAKTWPRRNVITRAIGVGAEPSLELAHGTLEAGDLFVLCSDGLTGHVDDHEILEAAQVGSAQAVCQSLVDLTLERGASDNVTVVAVRYVPAPVQPSLPTDTVVLPSHAMPDLGTA